MKIKDLVKVELYWGNFHDVVNKKTRKVVATLWTLNEAKKEKDYFKEFVGLNLNDLDFSKKDIYFKKAEDGILDIIVNIKKFNQKIFNNTLKEILK
ncbi:hypothetical protein KKA23_01590 [Patescibacteria group bacterium]|nr:hypothetical protein [Patescibacteria group bacterium]MBU3922609.1 hypothetical protein [Patescibacteria group bacterium]